MSRGNRDRDADYEVGYGKPPRHSRWQQGLSGNPKGRPKRALGKHQQLALAIDQPTRCMFMDEMCRPITVMSDGKKTTMPAVQVITRAMIKTAAEGGQQAQRTAIMLQLELERDLSRARAEVAALAREAKAKWQPELARRRALGLPEPDVLPHPDDIDIDEATEQVEIRGPSTPEQKAILDKIVAERDGYQRGVTGHQVSAAAKPRDWTLPMLAAMAQQRFDIINNLLPERYRKKLENRMTEAQIEAAREKVRKGFQARESRRAQRRAGATRSSRSQAA
ncbi:MAG: DUF5681 domain-containing protein [Sphingomicrobium sp.]